MNKMIKKEEVLELMAKKNKTLMDVARALNESHANIHCLLKGKRYNLEGKIQQARMQKVIDWLESLPNPKPLLTKKALGELMKSKRQTRKQVAEALGISTSVVTTLSSAGSVVNSDTEIAQTKMYKIKCYLDSIDFKKATLITPFEIEELMVKKGESAATVARGIGISSSVLYNALGHTDIEREHVQEYFKKAKEYLVYLEDMSEDNTKNGELRLIRQVRNKAKELTEQGYGKTRIKTTYSSLEHKKYNEVYGLKSKKAGQKKVTKDEQNAKIVQEIRELQAAKGKTLVEISKGTGISTLTLNNMLCKTNYNLNTELNQDRVKKITEYLAALPDKE